jgi:hypothetical protein
MNRHNITEASDFDGHGPTHRRGLRPRARGLQDDDRLELDDEQNSGPTSPPEQQHRRRLQPRTGLGDPATSTGPQEEDQEQRLRGSEAEASELPDITIQLPYIEQTCTICLETGTGHFLLPSTRSAVQHHADYHPDARIQFQRTRCEKKYVNLHGAQCHLPKCPGPLAPIEEGVQCEYCDRRFSSTRGLVSEGGASKRARTAEGSDPLDLFGSSLKEEITGSDVNISLRIKSRLVDCRDNFLV